MFLWNHAVHYERFVIRSYLEHARTNTKVKCKGLCVVLQISALVPTSKAAMRCSLQDLVYRSHFTEQAIPGHLLYISAN